MVGGDDYDGGGGGGDSIVANILLTSTEYLRVLLHCTTTNYHQ